MKTPPNFGAVRPACCSTVDAQRIVAAFVDAGHRLIDAADGYTGGQSERIVGDATKGRWEDVVSPPGVATRR